MASLLDFLQRGIPGFAGYDDVVRSFRRVAP